MSKSKSNGVATIEASGDVQLSLLQVDFDALDSIETAEPEPVQETAAYVAELIEDSEEQILATVESFDRTYGTDPLGAEWEKWGKKNKAHADNSSDAIFYIESARDLNNLAVKEHNLAPKSYDRAAVMKKAENVLRLCQVPESMIRPQELTAIFWLMMLDCSTASSEASEPRTFKHDINVSEWIGGNLTMGSLRVLAKCISRPSKANELDTWEYRAEYQEWTKKMVERLRAGELSVRQLERLLDAKKKSIAEAKKRARYAGHTAEEIASMETAEKNVTLQAKLTELSGDAVTFAKKYADELKKSPADLKQFLADRNVIPADPKPLGMSELAERMTPGDAKQLVQELVRLYETKPDRLNVFRALYGTCRAVVEQIRSAQQESAKVAKVA
jgi:hypothetical protein